MENDWKRCETQSFWGEIAPCDHVVQIYENNEIFIHTLQEFVVGGLRTGDCVILIATAEHLQALRDRLQDHELDLPAVLASQQLLLLNAEETLAKFMRNGWPDETLFNKVVDGLFATARRDSRRVRAFGEMVAVLWAQGRNGATVRLEHLWNKFCEREAFSLFCAYPKSGFTQDPASSIQHICATHTKVISGDEIPSGGINYMRVDRAQAG